MDPHLLPDIPADDPLIERCFLVYDESGRATSKGVVVGRVSPEVYLVRYFSWTTGEASTYRLVNLTDMVSAGLRHERRNSYEFFEDREHLETFIEERTRSAAAAAAPQPQSPAARPPAPAAPASKSPFKASAKAAAPAAGRKTPRKH
jgi:hypothetical protein